VDFEIIGYLKDSHPDLYRTLRRAVKSRHRPAPDAGVSLPPELEQGANSDFGEDEEVAPPDGHRPA
jgi:hypothetical protein